MSWGIAESASDFEIIRAESADYLDGLHSCGAIDYGDYSYAWDFYHDLLEEAYELGKKESRFAWIPCSEERPEFPCLACDKFEQIFIPAGIVTVGKLYYDGLQFNGNVEEFLKGEKTGYGARVLPRKIVAWMPLPEPYKEGAER